MLKIIHISDTHGLTIAVNTISWLLDMNSDCDIVAHTGDVVNSKAKYVSPAWDQWPQKYKLSVQGNHDVGYDPFGNTNSWTHTEAPWCYKIEDLLFIGFDLNTDNHLKQLYDCKPLIEKSNGVVILSHYRPEITPGLMFTETIKKILKEKPILILHGHDHPSDFEGADWQVHTSKNFKPLYISKIYSGYPGNLGLSHKIAWDNSEFTCEQIPTIIEFNMDDLLL